MQCKCLNCGKPCGVDEDFCCDECEQFYTDEDGGDGPRR